MQAKINISALANDLAHTAMNTNGIMFDWHGWRERVREELDGNLIVEAIEDANGTYTLQAPCGWSYRGAPRSSFMLVS